MKQYRFSFILFFFFLPTTANKNNNIALNNKNQKTTLLVYMAADNSLYPYADLDIQEMTKIGSSQNLNILVYLCTKKPNSPKITKRYYIKKGSAIQRGLESWQDSGDYKTVLRACQWALSQYPCDCFILDFWNHGSGSINRSKLESNIPYRAVCYDDTTGNVLLDSDLEKIGQFVTTLRKGKKIDIVAFDACLMSDIEIAYILAPYATYMVASQETIPGDGFCYDKVCSSLLKKTNPNEYAKAIVSAYKNEYVSKDKWFTLSAIDLSQIDALSININTLAQKLTSLLNSSYSESIKQLLTKSSSIQYCTSFDEPSYIDLGNLYSNILTFLNSTDLDESQKNELQKTLNDGLSLIKKAILAEAHGSAHPKATGLSIYFNQKEIDPDYLSLKWSTQTAWTTLLSAYLQA